VAREGRRVAGSGTIAPPLHLSLSKKNSLDRKFGAENPLFWGIQEQKLKFGTPIMSFVLNLELSVGKLSLCAIPTVLLFTCNSTYCCSAS